MKKNLYILLSSVALLLFSVSSFAQGFTGGSPQSFSICMNASSVNVGGLLTGSGSTPTTLDWHIQTPPINGSLGGFPTSMPYTTTPVTPSGLTYTPTLGYSGIDSFEIALFDGPVAIGLTKIYVTMDAPPAAGTILGPSTVCVGSSITLTDATPGGVWSNTSGNASVAGGIVTGVLAGMDVINYTVTNTCGAAGTSLTVNVTPTATAISGPGRICSGTVNTMSNGTSGGTWSSSNATVASIDPVTGVITAGLPGIANIQYSLPGGCNATRTVTTITSPAAIAGPSSVCAGYIVLFTNSTGGGFWYSSNTAIAKVSAGGLVTGVSTGSAVITYLVGTGCSATKVINVNPTSPITGTSAVCPGSSVILSTVIPGGTWTSSNTTVATANPVTGTVNGVTAGTAYISYTLPTGCYTFQLQTVNPLPAPISGSRLACPGTTTTLSDATPGGTWSSDNTAIAIIGPTTGVAGIGAVGTVNISYTLTGTGCAAWTTLTANPLPATYLVSGGGSYCSGDTGRHLYLSTSDVGTNYFLRRGTSVVGPFPGTGSMLDFGLMTVPGGYIVTGTDSRTTCSNYMAGSGLIVVTPTVPVSVTITPDMGDTICGGTNTIFNAITVNGGTTPSYEWMVNGIKVTKDTADYEFIPGNGDVVTVKLASSALCPSVDTATDTLVMTVVNREIPKVSLTPFPADVICMGAAVTLTPVPLFGGPSPKYYYMLNGKLIGTGSKLAYKPTDGDVFVVYMVSDFECRIVDTVNGSQLIHVDTPVIPYFQVEAYPPVLTTPGETVMLTAKVTNSKSVLKYQWYFNDKLIPGATTDTFISNEFDYMANDSVTCEVTQMGACYLTTFNWRKMLNNVGVQPVAAGNGNVSLFPNPNSGTFTLKGMLGSASTEDVTVELTNMLGQVVYKNTFTAPGGQVNEHLDVDNNLPNGMYMLTLRAPGANKVFHLVIER